MDKLQRDIQDLAVAKMKKDSHLQYQDAIEQAKRELAPKTETQGSWGIGIHSTVWKDAAGNILSASRGTSPDPNAPALEVWDDRHEAILQDIKDKGGKTDDPRLKPKIQELVSIRERMEAHKATQNLQVSAILVSHLVNGKSGVVENV